MSVKLDGVKETLRAIRKIDPELLKEMNKGRIKVKEGCGKQPQAA